MWHSDIVHVVDGSDQFWGHDDFTINGLDHVAEHGAHDVENLLELLDLLTQEYTQWNTLCWVDTWRSLQLAKSLHVLDLDEVGGQLLLELVLNLHFDLVFTRQATSATGLLWLGIDERVDQSQRLIETEGQISQVVQSEDEWTVLSWHRVDVLQVLWMLSCVWHLVLEVSEEGVEEEVWLEELLSEPDLDIGVEELTIQVVGNSSTILHVAGNEADSLPRVLTAASEAVGHMLVDEKQRGFHITIVEFVWHAEAEWAVLSTLDHDGVHKANGEDNVSPSVGGFDLLKEVSVDLSVEGT